MLFERIWVSCGSWELTKHTNKQQTLQKKISQSPTQLTDDVHLLLELGLGLGLGLDLSRLSWTLACLLVWYSSWCLSSGTCLLAGHHPLYITCPGPHFPFLTRSRFVIFPHNSCSLSSYLHHVYREVTYLYCMCCI